MESIEFKLPNMSVSVYSIVKASKYKQEKTSESNEKKISENLIDN